MNPDRHKTDAVRRNAFRGLHVLAEVMLVLLVIGMLVLVWLPAIVRPG